MQILKIGGSVITDKHQFEKPNLEAIKLVSNAIASALKQGDLNLIIVHGAGSFGHHHVIEYGLNDGIRTHKQWLGFCETRKAVAGLSNIFICELKKNGVPAVRFPPCSYIVSRNKRISNFNTKPIFDALDGGKVPVLHGDMVMDEELGGSVCSGDQIVSYLGKDAERVIMGTNVDGIMESGKLVERITGGNKDEILKKVGGSDAKDVTGGMRGKLLEIFKIPAPTYIVNAHKPERITSILLGKEAKCTKIKL